MSPNQIPHWMAPVPRAERPPEPESSEQELRAAAALEVAETAGTAEDETAETVETVETAEDAATVDRAVEAPAPRRRSLWERFVRWLRGGRRAELRDHFVALAVADAAPLLAGVAGAMWDRDDLVGAAVIRGILTDAADTLERSTADHALTRAARLRELTEPKEDPNHAY